MDKLTERNETERSYFGQIVSRFLKHRLAVAGLIFFILLIFIAIFAPILAPYDPYVVSSTLQSAPSAEHWLGTDAVGRDVLSRLIYASRVSLLVGVGSVAIYVSIGTIVGAVSGYFGGWMDMVFMRMTDIFMSFPSLMVMLVLVSIIGPSMFSIILILALFAWTGVARLVRGSVLSLKQMDYIQANVALGINSWRILFGHIIPNCLSPIIVNATFGIAGAIITEASLSFLGLGIQPPTASWGNMLTEAQSITVLTEQPWLWLPSGFMIVLAVLAINFVGDGLRDALDPKSMK
ncbi:oligopeptide ABC transporter permease [Paenibacillus phytorum]|uniref:oligopeptide ABC transporter permease n=1 Tax=Paenibacillus phytorum TaxID=2654977 RepID=UPI001FE9D736|nr:oligopeptide ABC transporter permease [Paenibacillus phytorum]